MFGLNLCKEALCLRHQPHPVYILFTALTGLICAGSPTPVPADDTQLANNARVVALFNRSDEDANMQVDWTQIKLPPGSATELCATCGNARTWCLQGQL